MNRPYLLIPAWLVLSGIFCAGIWSATYRQSFSSHFQLARRAGWGIDACLSCHISRGEVPGYLDLLKTSKIRWLRERGAGRLRAQPAGDRGGANPDPQTSISNLPVASKQLRVWREETAAGFDVVGFTFLPGPVPVEQPGNQLPEDLLAVFEQSKLLARLTRGTVAAWEMVGEPDAFYCKDLPDRVAAYQKAVYLGLKSGRDTRLFGDGRRKMEDGGALLSPISDRLSSSYVPRPIVLTGGLAFPPGPWLELAAENGLYEYSDAVNFHHYGFARDFSDVVRAHRELAARWSGRGELPVWCTEAGLNNIQSGRDGASLAARNVQADYILDCARQARDEHLAVFMPFILVHGNDPFAMTESAGKVFPAWNAYRDFTNTHPVSGDIPVARPPRSPNPVVLQWVADNGTCDPSKITRSYQFQELGSGQWMSVTGELRIYNFSGEAVRIFLREASGSANSRIRVRSGELFEEGKSKILEIPAAGKIELPVIIEALDGNYFREKVKFEATSLSRSGRILDVTQVVFLMETPPALDLPHQVQRISMESPQGESISYISAPYAEPAITSKVSPWWGVNGVEIDSVTEGGAAAVFHVGNEGMDPLAPPMAVVFTPNGLPTVSNGFLRLHTVDERGTPSLVRVDLIDDVGQRFSIVENYGRSYFEPIQNTVLLGYTDFVRWVFGRCVGGQPFDPGRIREIQLRFPSGGGRRMCNVVLDVVGFEARE